MSMQTTNRMPPDLTRANAEDACRIQWWHVGLDTTTAAHVAPAQDDPDAEQVERRLKRAAAQSFTHGGED